VYPSSNDIWSRDLDINNTNGKEIVCSATQHETKNGERQQLTTNNWMKDQTKVMDIMEMVNTENGHGQVTSVVERILDVVLH